MPRLAFAALFILLLNACSAGPTPNNPVAGLDKRSGFFDVFVDENKNRVLAKLPAANEDGVSLRMIHTARLTAGLGSNPVGLDRGWGNGGQILVFRKLGNKMVLEIENMTYRASAEDPLERRAVRESFATSFIASTDIISSDGGNLVDLTAFLTSDILNLVQYLKDRDQGSFKIAKDRTLVDASNVFAFPDNVEIDVFLTLSSADPGREVSTTAANGNDITLIQHHSFVRLPEEGYTPLASDPRVGVVERVHYDYSADLSAPIETRLARRYRLQKNEDGETINPIVFYIDSGAPEPIRSALVEGGQWWQGAFEAAGYPDGYRVEVLPEDAHPLDVRYNVVQWVHRQTRGWSYGGGVSDPRTGEMLKGHVNLGSLRVRQDRMIFEGLSGTSRTDTGEPNDPVQLALQRIRQLSAHEIGHSLGFAHNFAASTYGKGSVMDYPAPDIRVRDGQLDFSNTYGVGIGEWDKFAATWLYTDFDDEARRALVAKSIADGLVFVADRDGRNVGSAHPLGNIWDNGQDPISGLQDAMQVRALALENFGNDRILAGRPVSDLNKVIVPIYLYHRYQTAAAAKLIGGMDFNYALNGDGQPAASIVSSDKQRRALTALLSTIDPAELDLPDRVLNLLTPNIRSYVAADGDRELFKQTGYPAFDTVSAAETAADLTFDVLLHSRRLARLQEFHRRDPNQLSLDEMLATIQRKVMTGPTTGRLGPISEAIQTRFAFALMEQAQSDVSGAIAAKLEAALGDLSSSLSSQDTDHALWLVAQIATFEQRPAAPAKIAKPAKALPPGGPIGMEVMETCWHC